MITLSRLPPTARLYRILYRAEYDRPNDRVRSLLCTARTVYSAIRGFNRRYGHVAIVDVQVLR